MRAQFHFLPPPPPSRFASPFPAQRARILEIADHLGVRHVLIFPCEACGAAQCYSAQTLTAICLRCESGAVGRDESTSV